MLFDRDVVAFYGDPAMRVTFDDAKIPADVAMTFEKRDGLYSLTAINGKSMQGARSGSPTCYWLPERILHPVVVSGAEVEPLLTDDFIMLMKPDYTPGATNAVSFKSGSVEASGKECRSASNRTLAI